MELKFLLTKIEKVIVLIAVTAAITGMVSAYAQEEFTYGENPGFEIGSAECTRSLENNLGIAICILKQNNTSGYTGNQTQGGSGPEVPCEEGFSRDGKTGLCRETEGLTNEAIAECKTNPNCPLEWDLPLGDTIEFDGRTFPTDPGTKTDQKIIDDINNMLATNAKCFQGKQGTNTAGIQEFRGFPIPTRLIPDGLGGQKLILDLRPTTSNEDLRSYLGVIEKRKQECRAQIMLDDPHFPKILSVVDKNFAFCDSLDGPTGYKKMRSNNYLIPWCGNSGITQALIIAEKIPDQTADMVNQKANFGIEKDSNPLSPEICKQYSKISQEAIGCEIDYSVGLNEDGSCRTGTDHNEDLTRCIPSQSGKTPPEMNNYGPEIEAKVNQWKLDGGVELAKQYLKDQIAEDIRKLNKQLRALEDQ